jgi:hypothetical protein
MEAHLRNAQSAQTASAPLPETETANENQENEEWRADEQRRKNRFLQPQSLCAPVSTGTGVFVPVAQSPERAASHK